VILQTVVDPISLWGEAGKPSEYRKINGIICQVELLDSGKLSVSRLISTNPGDFLDKRLFPGRIIG